MSKIAIGTLMVAILGVVGATVVAATNAPGTPEIRNAAATTTTATGTVENRTATAEDRTTATATTEDRTTTAPSAGVDVSGPCDEAEHANDPRCTGAVGAAGDRGDDHRGRGRGRGGDDAFDDHGGNDSSGHGSGGGGNSGRGGDDNSGHGGGHD